MSRSTEIAHAPIRLASEQDVADIHALIVELATATHKRDQVRSQPGDFLRLGFGEQPAFRALIAEHDGRVVGLSLFFFSFSSWRGELGVYVQDLVVAEAVRGGGLGRRLMAETARLARQSGATHLRLSVDRNNPSAIGFYRDIGLEQADDELILQAEGAAFSCLVEIQ